MMNDDQRKKPKTDMIHTGIDQGGLPAWSKPELKILSIPEDTRNGSSTGADITVGTAS